MQTIVDSLVQFIAVANPAFVHCRQFPSVHCSCVPTVFPISDSHWSSLEISALSAALGEPLRTAQIESRFESKRYYSLLEALLNLKLLKLLMEGD